MPVWSVKKERDRFTAAIFTAPALIATVCLLFYSHHSKQLQWCSAVGYHKSLN